MALSTQITTKKGSIGLVMPTGLFVEDKPYPLRSYLLSKGRIESIGIYQNNKHGFFESVHASTLFCTFVYVKSDPGAIRFSTIKKYGDNSPHHFFEGHIKELLGPDLTLTLFHDHKLLRTYQLAQRNLGQLDQLKYKVKAEFHASSDKNLFQDNLHNEKDWRLLKNDGINQFDHNYGSPIGYISHKIVEEKDKSKGFPQWLNNESSPKRLVFRDIARADDSRSVIACLLPYGYVSSYDIPMVLPNDEPGENDLYFYLGYMNSLIFDFMVRPHVDKHIKGYILKRAPFPKYNNKNRLMQCITDIAKLISFNNDGSYGEERAKIDAGVALLANLDENDLKKICRSFSSLMKREGFRDYVAMVCEHKRKMEVLIKEDA